MIMMVHLSAFEQSTSLYDLGFIPLPLKPEHFHKEEGSLRLVVINLPNC